MNAGTFKARWLFALCLAASGVASSQSVSTREIPGGGWGVIEAPKEYISEASQHALWQTIQGNIEMLRAQGRLPALKADLAVRFSWPTRFASGWPEFHDHAVSSYVDQDPAGDSVRDFNCGIRAYDTAVMGGGHKGTDISLGFRPFYKQDTEQVVVVAAATGTIIAREDIQPDRSCGNLTDLFADTSLRNNVISIRHADGSVASYYHVKTGSLTAKDIGDAVVEGEYLGAVGSAGFSSGPHLHFEVRSATNEVIDPWAGACNPTTAVSLWKTQEPYRVQEIMDLIPSSTAPTAANMNTTCTDNVADSKPASGYLQPNHYAQPGVPHNFLAFLRDIDVGSQVVLSLQRPDGSQYATAAGTGFAYAETAYVYINSAIPVSEPAGKWSFVASYGGKTKSVPFNFNVPMPPPARVFEFHNDALGHYFRTAAAAEAQSLTPESGFLPTGEDFFTLDRTVDLAGVSPVCRFYGSPNPGPNSHFYTADPAECAAVKSIQAQTPAWVPRWNFEEIAFAAYMPIAGACPTEAPFPVYRLYNQHAGDIINGEREDSNHRFTTLSSVYNQMGLQGWRGEGVVMCAESKP